MEGLDMSNDPHSVPLSKVLAFLRDLGIDPVEPADLQSFTIDAHGVKVVRYRRDEQGSYYPAGPNEMATETVTMALDADA